MNRGTDTGHELTEKELSKLEKRISKVYRQAGKELQGTITDYFEKFKERDEEMKALIGTEINGKEWTEQDYKHWRLNQMARGERYQAMREKVAQRMTAANEVAVSYTNDATPGIYSLNRNYAAYTIEQVSPNADFTLWDEQTVKRLIVEEPDLLPYYPKARAVKRGIDLAYGKKQITASVTSSILQGKSIKGIADDLQGRITTMNRSSAIRTARTAVTGAQNAGRMDSYGAAGKMGIKLKKEWLATLDARTRHSHAMLDGEQVAQDKKFSNGCRFPGDPQGPAWETYNCRCTLIAAVDGVDTSDAERWSRDPETGERKLVSDMSYQEWAGWKEIEQKTVVNSTGNGIISTGAKGALTSQNDPDFTKRDSHAKTYYSSVRNSSKASIVQVIATNSGIDRGTVDAAITHLFYEKHDLEKGFTYFDEDYDIAQSIQRLRTGRNMQQHDLILLQHEALESQYMHSGLTYEEAHRKAEIEYNFRAALIAFLKANNLE